VQYLDLAKRHNLCNLNPMAAKILLPFPLRGMVKIVAYSGAGFREELPPMFF